MHNAHAYENLTQDNSNGDLENKIDVGALGPGAHYLGI